MYSLIWSFTLDRKARSKVQIKKTNKETSLNCIIPNTFFFRYSFTSWGNSSQFLCNNNDRWIIGQYFIMIMGYRGRRRFNIPANSRCRDFSSFIHQRLITSFIMLHLSHSGTDLSCFESYKPTIIALLDLVLIRVSVILNF